VIFWLRVQVVPKDVSNTAVFSLVIENTTCEGSFQAETDLFCLATPPHPTLPTFLVIGIDVCYQGVSKAFQNQPYLTPDRISRRLA